MTHADGYFAIGKTHTVCQDYVRHGVMPNGRAYVIVSDGCSGSKDTDIGARWLTLAMQNYIRLDIPTNRDDWINFSIPAHYAASFCSQALFDQTCLDATLLVAIETDTQILVYTMGDGVVAHRLRDGTWGYESHEFTSGAPYYPNYLNHSSRRHIYQTDWNSPVVRSVGGQNGEVSSSMPLSDYTHHERRGTPTVFNKSDVDLVVLMTDGACSFRKGLDPVPLAQVARQVLDVKVPTGEFMVRRAKRFLGNYCAANGWHHDDDFGVGAIFVDGIAP